MTTPDLHSLLLWQDAYLLAVNKPAGLRTIPDGYDPEQPCLSRMLAAAFGKIWVVHRLDKDTSGLVLFARTAEAHRQLNLQFEQRQVQKTYHALVYGAPSWQHVSVEQPLLVNGDRRHRTVVDEQHGRPAQTDLERLQSFADCALLAARPRTGYTHQIRTHLAWLGFPILADPLYARKPIVAVSPLSTAPILQRLALHARQLNCIHPITHQTLSLQAPYPLDFQDTLDWLATTARI